MEYLSNYINIDLTKYNSVFGNTFFGNTFQDYLISFVIFLLLVLLLKIFNLYIIKIIKKFAEKTETKIDDTLVEVIESIHWPFYVFVSFFIASKPLILPVLIDKLIFYIFVLTLGYYVIKGINRFVNYFATEEIDKRKEKDKEADTSIVDFLSKLIRITIWIIGVLVLMSIVGIKITPLLAGLGIGGIAIAFALQNILGDLFSSFSIYFDKPFEKGDFVIIGTDMGNIEKVGLRSTRINTLEGQKLIVSNRELTTIRINNYKQIEKRRVTFNIGVTFNTPVNKLKKINSLVENLIKHVEKAEFKRIHFKEIGNFSLNYEIVYFVHSKSYTEYLKTREEINLKIMEAFQKEKINFAFPTQTVIMQKN